VTVLHGDWRLIEGYGPFDLLDLDGGGGGKRGNDTPADPAGLLRPGGTLVLDDFHPPLEFWPEEAGPRDEYGRSTTAARAHWLQHPDLCPRPRSGCTRKCPRSWPPGRRPRRDRVASLTTGARVDGQRRDASI
jgi:hypothetical protein